MVRRLDFSPQGWGRVVVLSALGTLVCIAVAFAIDSYSLETGTWRWGSDPINNLIIPLVLAPPIFGFLLSRQRALAIAHDQLMVVASTDGLTACLNRRAFTTLVDAYLDKIAAEESRREGALLVIDVDHFKVINDNFGHDLGDQALKVIAQTIKDAVREIDLVGRMGGEEFSVFLPGIDPERTAIVAERIRRAVSSAEFTPDGQKCALSISVGGATFERGASFAELYKFADQRLYAAKRNGRNRVEIHRGGTDAAPVLH